MLREEAISAQPVAAIARQSIIGIGALNGGIGIMVNAE